MEIERRGSSGHRYGQRAAWECSSLWACWSEPLVGLTNCGLMSSNGKITGLGGGADRFHDTNVAVLAEADALVCLRVARRESKAGGTQAMNAVSATRRP